MKHFIRKRNKYLKTIPRESLPPRVMTLEESREFFPTNPHLWLCDGKLLRLLDPEDVTNADLFQVTYISNYPIMLIKYLNVISIFIISLTTFYLK